MKAISPSVLRSRMKEYLDEVVQNEEVILVPRGKDDDDTVVMLSLREYNALLETGHLLSSKRNAKRLEESIQQMAKGKLISFDAGTGKKKRSKR